MTLHDFITEIVKIFARWPAVVAMVSALIFFAREHRHHPRKFFREVAVTSVVTFIAWCVTAILKVTIRAPRPFVDQGIETTFRVMDYTSFPSGHATMFFALAMIIFLYNKRTGLMLFAFATIIATSRVIAGIHYPIDVIAGALIGMGVAWGTFWLMGRYWKRGK